MSDLLGCTVYSLSLLLLSKTRPILPSPELSREPSFADNFSKRPGNNEYNSYTLSLSQLFARIASLGPSSPRKRREEPLLSSDRAQPPPSAGGLRKHHLSTDEETEAQ